MVAYLHVADVALVVPCDGLDHARLPCPRAAVEEVGPFIPVNPKAYINAG